MAQEADLQCPWLQYHHPLIRELTWCLCSPNLLAGTRFHQHRLQQPIPYVEIKDWLDSLTVDPSSLENHMQQLKTPRLGFVFEHYWRFYWLHQLGDSYNEDDDDNESNNKKGKGNWLNNLQVQGNKKTLGEIDMVQQQKHQLCHIEMAVKFYLAFEKASPKETEDYWWLGPNCRDRLDLKLHQLDSHQLQLLSSNEAKSLLPEHWQNLPVNTEILLRGQLFYPINNMCNNFDPLLNKQHLNSYWTYQKDLKVLLEREDKNITYIPLEKREWLCTPSVIAPSRELTQQQFTDQSDDLSKTKPTMISAGNWKTENGEKFFWQEKQRFFVAPNHWPDISKLTS